MSSPVVRTPDECFINLPDFSFKAHYVEINGVRVHYIDEGEGNVILCLHGEPTWSFLYRKMIPILAAKHRVVAMDFIGFGKSDKFATEDAYAFQMHRDTLVRFIEGLSLNQITLVGQDWGGSLGLSVVSDMPQRFARLVIMNTILVTGDIELPPALYEWRESIAKTHSLSIDQVIRRGIVHNERVSPEVIAGYTAPFPEESYKAGAIAWPLHIPVNFDDPVALELRRVRKFLTTWNKPTLVMFSDSDPFTKGKDQFFRELIPAAKNEPAIVIKDAGHFLQEEKGEEIAQFIRDFIMCTPIG